MISVVLATHNEETNLKKYLLSVKSFADEIIVVDGESKDNTVLVARELGATVISTTNKSNFHINKQIAIDKAKGDLVLQLDADEEVDSELSENIKIIHEQILDKNYDIYLKPVAWYLKRKNFFLGKFLKKGGQYPDPVIRLFIRGKAKLPQKDIHEQMIVEGIKGWADGHLLHFSNPSFKDYLRKFNTYTDFKAEQLATKRIKISFFNSCKYLLWLPCTNFLSLYIRHKGFLDGIPGLVFAIFSGLHHTVSYLKLWEFYELKK